MNVLRAKNFFCNLNATRWIIVLNVAFFIIAIFFSKNQNFLDYFALKPDNILHFRYLWTLLTSFFLHLNFSHLFVNMLSLLFIGSFVERVIGRKRFLFIYLISGLIAGLFFTFLALAFQSELQVYAIGASGAIFALGGLLMILTPKLPVLVFFMIPMKMFNAMLSLLIALWVISWLSGLPIGNTAHLGGLVSGIAYGLYLKRKYKKKIMMLNRMFS